MFFVRDLAVGNDLFCKCLNMLIAASSASSLILGGNCCLLLAVFFGRIPSQWNGLGVGSAIECALLFPYMHQSRSVAHRLK